MLLCADRNFWNMSCISWSSGFAGCRFGRIYCVINMMVITKPGGIELKKKKKIREENKTPKTKWCKWKQLPPTDRWSACTWAVAALPTSPPVWLLSKMSYGREYPFGQLGSAVPTVSPPNFLCTSNLLTGRAVWEAEKALTLCKHCSAITKTSLYYQSTLFPAQIQNIAPY